MASAFTVRKSKEFARCTSQGQCAGPYPYSTGSMQGLSQPLARQLAASRAAADNVRNATGTFPRRVWGKESMLPVFEDAWMGFALVALLPPDAARTITFAAYGPWHASDHFGFSMTNLTMLVHWKVNKGAESLRARMHAAHEHATAYHCLVNETLRCSSRTHATNWAKDYATKGSCRGCTTGRWMACQLGISKEGTQDCKGYKEHKFRTSAVLLSLSQSVRASRSGPAAAQQTIRAHGKLLNSDSYHTTP